MSSKLLNIFNSYGEALDKALNNKGLSRKWLAKKIVDEDSKLQSMQSQISRWISGGSVSEIYQQRINNSLNIFIHQDKNGDWVIDEPDSQDSLNEPKVVYADKVDLPKDGKLSRDQMKDLLGQIEVISRILKDSL